MLSGLVCLEAELELPSRALHGVPEDTCWESSLSCPSNNSSNSSSRRPNSNAAQGSNLALDGRITSFERRSCWSGLKPTPPPRGCLSLLCSGASFVSKRKERKERSPSPPQGAHRRRREPQQQKQQQQQSPTPPLHRSFRSGWGAQEPFLTAAISFQVNAALDQQ